MARLGVRNMLRVGPATEFDPGTDDFVLGARGAGVGGAHPDAEMLTGDAATALALSTGGGANSFLIPFSDWSNAEGRISEVSEISAFGAGDMFADYSSSVSAAASGGQSLLSNEAAVTAGAFLSDAIAGQMELLQSYAGPDALPSVIDAATLGHGAEAGVDGLPDFEATVSGPVSVFGGETLLSNEAVAAIDAFISDAIAGRTELLQSYTDPDSLPLVIDAATLGSGASTGVDGPLGFDTTPSGPESVDEQVTTSWLDVWAHHSGLMAREPLSDFVHGPFDWII